MAQFSINTNRVKGAANDEYIMVYKLSGYSCEIKKIANGLDMSSPAASGIRSSLRSAAEKAARYSKSMRGMESALNYIADKYDSTERSVRDSSQFGVLGAGTAAGVAMDVLNKPNATDTQGGMAGGWISVIDILEGWLYKPSVAASGLLGTVIDATKKFTNGEWAKGIGDVIKLTGKVVKNVDGTKANWFGDLMGNLFGVVKPKPGNVKTAWETATGKYFDFSDVKKGVSSVCNWAAALIGSGYENYKEFGGFQNPRAMQETAIETTLNVAEGMAVTAFVATVIGTGGVPLVAGAITAGVTIAVDKGLDALTKWITGDADANWKEAISDGICDFSEWLDESAGKAGQWVGEKARVAVDWVQDKAEAAVDWVSDQVTNVVDNVKTGISNGLDAVKNGFGSLCSWGKKLAFG